LEVVERGHSGEDGRGAFGQPSYRSEEVVMADISDNESDATGFAISILLVAQVDPRCESGNMGQTRSLPSDEGDLR
jgi:hypothetical protein